jgi:hypothetical protein
MRSGTLMGWTFDDLRRAPKRKPSSKRSRQDAANFKAAQQHRWKTIEAEARSEADERQKLKQEGVDWGIEFDE